MHCALNPPRTHALTCEADFLVLMRAPRGLPKAARADCEDARSIEPRGEGRRLRGEGGRGGAVWGGVGRWVLGGLRELRAEDKRRGSNSSRCILAEGR